jgi:hypothetical protein
MKAGLGFERRYKILNDLEQCFNQWKSQRK